MSRKPESEDMHHEVEWMRPSDRPILEELADYGGWMTPKGLSLNLPYTSNWVGQRLRELVEYELVERQKDEPGYKITERGREFLAGDLDADDLDG
jgi:predicted transcriptional regulator